MMLRQCLGVPGVRRCRTLTSRSRCVDCEAETRRNRRDPNYDNPFFRKTKAAYKKARKMCERCGQRPGRVLHHRDYNTANNVLTNYEWLCKPCDDAEHR